jgi:hypothetical protein
MWCKRHEESRRERDRYNKRDRNRDWKCDADSARDRDRDRVSDRDTALMLWCSESTRKRGDPASHLILSMSSTARFEPVMRESSFQRQTRTRQSERPRKEWVLIGRVYWNNIARVPPLPLPLSFYARGFERERKKYQRKGVTLCYSPSSMKIPKAGIWINPGKWRDLNW